jgi:hypothetical protein
MSDEIKKPGHMNALKHGKYMRQFQRIKEQAGKLAICKQCGEQQQEECALAKKCHLQEELIYAYHLARTERDLSGIEIINTMQLASMDLIFSQKLRWAIENAGETEKYFDKSIGRNVERPVVKNEDLYQLMNMMQSLSKSLPDMQLTRQTQETIDVEWAKLLEAKISEEQAAANRERILDVMKNWNQAKEAAEKMQKTDSAIQNFINTGKVDALPEKTNKTVNPFDE